MTSDARTWDQLREEAADWLAGMDTGEANPVEFEAWRDADPRHAAAFAQVAEALLTVDRVKPDVKAVVGPVRAVSRRTILTASAAIAAVVGGSGAFVVATAKSTIETGVGEQRSVPLGSIGNLQVNTASKVRYRQSGPVTDVWLEKGEVALDLASGGGTCRLHAGDRLVEFSAARVNARLRGGMLDLAVVSGNCTLKPPKAAAGTGRVSPTDTLITANHAVITGPTEAVVRPLNSVDKAFLTAWPQGELLFEGQTLETAVAEYNRYLRHKMVIADASLSAIQLGGRFKSRDPETFLRALDVGFGIRATHDQQGNIALTK